MASPRDATIDMPQNAAASRPHTGSRTADAASIGPLSASGDLPSKKLGAHRGPVVENGQQLNVPEDGALTQMGRLYLTIFNFSVITRYLVYVLPLALLIAIPIIVGAVAVKDASIGGVRIVWFFTWVEVVWLSLWVSKFVARYIPFTFQFLCGIVSPGTRKYALVLRALETPLFLVAWSVTSLATFIPLMTRNPDKRESGDTRIKGWQDVVNNILFAAFVSTLILAAEKALVQLIAVSHHRRRFDMKIQESKRNVHLLTLLYEASRKMFPDYCQEFELEDHLIAGSVVPVGKISPGGSGSSMSLVQNIGKLGGKISSRFGDVAQELTGKQVFNSNSAHSIVILALENQNSSEALAKRLWMSSVLQGRDALYLADLKEIFGPERMAEAEDGFTLLDRDGNGDVSLEEMILTVNELGAARQSISKSMRDVDQAISALDKLLCVVVFIGVVLVFIAFLNSGFGTTLAAGAAALLSLSFVFARTAHEVLSSCIFLFVKHPFDVGDRVDIGSRTLVVEGMSLLYTNFRSVADQRTIQVANAVLDTQWTDNISRSKAMRERVILTADFGTSFGDIQLLKNEMQKFVREKENCRDFQRDVDIDVLGLGEMDKLELSIEIRHKSNWSNESIRATRRSRFMCALVAAIRKVPIYGPGGGDAALGAPGNPSYSVAISDEQAQEKRDKFASDKEEDRLVPTSEMDSILPSQPGPTSQSQTTGFESHDRSDSGLQYRTSAAAASTNRPAGMDQGRINESDPSNPVIRETSTGRRKPTTNPTFVPPNTPTDDDGQTPSVPDRPSPVDHDDEYGTPFPPGSGFQNPYPSNSSYPPRPPPPQTGLSYSAPPPPPPPPKAAQHVPPRRPVGNAFAPQQQQQRPPPPPHEGDDAPVLC